jgi:AraC family transcriptional regulator
MKYLKSIYREFCGFDVPEHTAKRHVFMIIHRDSQLQCRLGDRTKDGFVNSDDVIFCPAGVPYSVKWENEAHYSVISIKQNCFDNPIFQTLDQAKVEMIPHFAQADPLIFGIGCALKQLQHNEFNQSYFDSMIALLAAHILEWKCLQKFEQMEKDGVPSYRDRQHN